MSSRADTVAVALVLGVGAGLALWRALAGQLPFGVQVGSFAALMLAGGIPHGALDHLIVEETERRDGRRTSRVRFLVGYVATMALYAVTWRLAPVFSLGLFLLLSAWHFGDTDLERAPLSERGAPARLLLGGFVLALLLFTHAAEVTPLLERLSHDHAPTLAFWNGGLRARVPLLLVSGAGALLLQRPVSPGVEQERWLAGWGAVLLLGCALPLLVAFALYFGGWHAWHSFRDIQRYLARSGHRSGFGLWRRALPFTLLALGSGVGLAALWRWSGWKADPLPLVFIFLAVVTLPHLRVMHGMNRRLA